MENKPKDVIKDIGDDILNENRKDVSMVSLDEEGNLIEKKASIKEAKDYISKIVINLD